MLFVGQLQRMVALAAAIVPTVVNFLPQPLGKAADCPDPLRQFPHRDNHPFRGDALCWPTYLTPPAARLPGWHFQTSLP